MRKWINENSDSVAKIIYLVLFCATMAVYAIEQILHLGIFMLTGEWTTH